MSLTINFSLNANAASTLTFRGITLTSNKGGDGTQNGNGGMGGTATGGLYNVSGGNGQYASGDDGGGGGGGINEGVGYYNVSPDSGGIGGSSSDFRNLQAALTLINASYTLGPGGNGGGSGSTNIENMNGISSSSVGAGGGGAGWYGGAGGNGYIGGGGGGAASYSVARNGGNGGSACLILRYKTTVDTAVILYTPSTSYTLPSDTVTVSVWLIGAGGNGGNASAGDGNSASGGGAGGMAYYEWSIRQTATVLVSGAASKTIVNKYLVNSPIAFGPFTTTNTDGGYTVKHTSLNTSVVTIPSNSIATANIIGPGTALIQTEFTQTANFFASSGTYVTILIVGPSTTYTTANMTNVDLSGTDIRGTVFSDCNLQNANLYAATVNDTTDFRTVNNMQNLRSGRIYGITALFPSGYKLI
jgi:hypothetical protein